MTSSGRSVLRLYVSLVCACDLDTLNHGVCQQQQKGLTQIILYSYQEYRAGGAIWRTENIVHSADRGTSRFDGCCGNDDHFHIG
jgi:hypothetical protein